MAASGRLLCHQLHASSGASHNLRNSIVGFLPRDDSRIHEKKKNMVAMRDLGASYPATTSSLSLEAGMEGLMDLPVAVSDAAATSLRTLRENNVRKRKVSAAQIQMLVEKGILNCRFFTLAAVAGSLVGSIICFVEGCLLVLNSFFEHFRSVADHVHDGETMHMLIEALDMYLLGTGMLNFGFGLYAMFVGSRGMTGYGNLKSVSAGSSGLAVRRLHQMILPSVIEKKWLSQAKTRLGRAVLTLLQSGTVDKFKNVPLATGFDLACFAGAILISSACLFLLSRRLQPPTKLEEREK